MVWITDMLMEEISLKPRAPLFSGESRYLTPLWVQGNNDQPDSTITNLELGAVRIESNHQKIQDKIVATLKLLTFREQYVLVQFWWPLEAGIGKHQLLTTLGQPFGIGVNDERILSYRRVSERKPLVLDKGHEEEYCSPAARVFIRGLPEWTPDVTNYLPKHFPLLECAVRCNLHGYLALPVFDLDTRLCVGVLELLTSTKYTSYAYEVQRIHNALQMVDLRTQQAFDCPALNVPNDRRQKDYNKIRDILKTTSDIHDVPFAQTWAVSQHTSFVSHEKVIQKSCSSFNSRCVRKGCMSTAALPFHVKDLRMWPFREACRVRHLDISLGFVGKAFSSRGSCFCRDVTKLGEEEYPLVHNACMNRLTSCFAIFLRSIEANDNYVLEFFLPPGVKDSGHVLNLVQTLKQSIPIGSGFELGDNSCIQVVGPPTEVSISLTIDPHTVQISSITTENNKKVDTVTSDSESIMVNIANKTKSSANVSNQWPSKQIYLDKFSDINSGTENLSAGDFMRHGFNVVDAKKDNIMISYSNVNLPGGKDKSLKQVRKRKADSLTLEAVEEHVGRLIDQAVKSPDVSRSTLKRFCGEHDMPSWPLPKYSKKSVPIINLMLSENSSPKKNLQLRMSLSFVVFLMVRVKRWSCSTKRHGFSGKWWSCGTHSTLPSKSDSIYQAAHLLIRLRRWRNMNSIRHSLQNGGLAVVSKSPTKPKYTHVRDIKTVTVKATFKNDMIKFQFPTSSGLLELEHEVARRIKSKSRRFRLKYKDEDNDLILLACNADLHHLLRLTPDHSTIKLIIVDDQL